MQKLELTGHIDQEGAMTIHNKSALSEWTRQNPGRNILIKFSRLHFESEEKHAMLLAAYRSFNAKAYIDMASDSDNRGNKSNSFNKKVETNLPVDFVLNIPIFKGQDRLKFHVEICLEVTDGGCNFWFESVELHELIEIESGRILNGELEACSDYVVIWK